MHRRHAPSPPKRSASQRSLLAKKTLLQSKSRDENLTDHELAVLANLPVSQIEEFREIFRLVDTDGNGSVDIKELKELMTSLHYDSFMLSDEYFAELISRVKEFSGHSKDSMPQENDADLQFSFDELMLSILARPDIKYTKNDVRDAFRLLAGASSRPGTIAHEKLARAIAHGAGGVDLMTAEEIMGMMEHAPGGIIDYNEIINLFIGIDETPITNKKDFPLLNNHKKMGKKHAGQMANAHHAHHDQKQDHKHDQKQSQKSDHK